MARSWVGRGLRLAFRLVLLAAVFVVGFAAWLFFRAMPTYAGDSSINNLAAEVRVWSDGYAVPHIFARDADSAARALGYLHASERLLQMEIQRRAGEGRLAEMLGPDLVHVDRFIRTLGVPQAADASFAALTPAAQSRLRAYADGVNAFLSSHAHALPVEFLLLGVEPEPWKPLDSMVIGKLLGLQLSHNYRMEELRARVAAKLGPEKTNWVFADTTINAPVTTDPRPDADHAHADSYEELARWSPFARGASNEWVVSGARTATGKPILANDPHLDLGAPILWYMARIVTPDDDLRGASIPGTPTVLLGCNKSIAWGLTSALTDTQDLFVETLDPADPNKYQTPNGAVAFTTHQETIHVKGADDVLFTVRATRHGPVLSDVDDQLRDIAGAGKVMALAFAGLSDHDTTYDAILQLNAAHSWDDFTAALKLFQTPTQNFAYADVNGDIGFVSAGLVPVRKSGDGMTPADGASGADDWTGFVPFEKLPQAHNPEAGFLFNANNALVGPDRAAAFGRDFEAPWRARRIQQWLSRPEKHDVETSAAMQLDTVSPALVAAKPLLAAVKPTDERARQALSLVAAWDGTTAADRAEPVIAESFMYELHKALIVDTSGVSPDGELGPLQATAVLSLVKNHPEMCARGAEPDPDCALTLARALDRALTGIVAAQGADMSRWQWGVTQPAILQHKVFSHVPLLDWWSDLSFPSGGDFYSLNRGGGFDTPADKPLARTQAGGYRGVFDLADLTKSRFIIATGQSGHIFSPHYRDLLPLWRKGQAIALTGSEEELKAHGATLFVFRPGER